MKKNLKRGVYYLPSWDRIVLLTNVKLYEDLFNPRFSISTWEDGRGVYEKTLIRGKFYERLIWLGSF